MGSDGVFDCLLLEVQLGTGSTLVLLKKKKESVNVNGVNGNKHVVRGFRVLHSIQQWLPEHSTADCAVSDILNTAVISQLYFLLFDHKIQFLE